MVMRWESAHHLVHAVGDEEDQAALARQALDQREDGLAVVEVEGRRHLVEDQDPRLADQRPGEHDELLGGERQVPGLGVGVDDGRRAERERLARGVAAGGARQAAAERSRHSRGERCR